MTPTNPIPSGESETTADMFLGGRLTIEQPARGFRAGLDAVLLAAAVREADEGSLTVLDAGAGVGTAGLCVASRIAGAQVTLVERAPSLLALAHRNIERNNLQGRVRVIESDIQTSAGEQEAAGLAPCSFAAVIANPPYLEVGRHRLPEDVVAAGAFGHEAGGLEAWFRFLARMTAADGRMVMIHRADALGEVLAAIGQRFGNLRILPVYPRAGDRAHRIVVRGRKASRAPMQLLSGLVLHGAGNAFLPEVQAVLRDGAPLPQA